MLPSLFAQAGHGLLLSLKHPRLMAGSWGPFVRSGTERTTSGGPPILEGSVAERGICFSVDETAQPPCRLRGGRLG
jgi:hypothetical protein